jgi:two-component system sensor histidine kinase KdpD
MWLRGVDDVVATIDDHGPGLPPGREEAIFQKFERGSKESAMPGVGLGLAICRAIVEAHGGSIRAESRETGGARFAVRLPRGQPPHDDGGGAAVVDADTG